MNAARYGDLPYDEVVIEPGITDRERLLIEMLFDARLTCPYLLKQVLGDRAAGIEGNHGPNTCNAGCSDEPACVTGPAESIEHPDLLAAVAERWLENA